MDPFIALSSSRPKEISCLPEGLTVFLPTRSSGGKNCLCESVWVRGQLINNGKCADRKRPYLLHRAGTAKNLNFNSAADFLQMLAEGISRIFTAFFQVFIELKLLRKGFPIFDVFSLALFGFGNLAG